MKQKSLPKQLVKKESLQKHKTIVLQKRQKQLIAQGTAKGCELLFLQRQIDEEMYIKRETNEALIVGTKVSKA